MNQSLLYVPAEEHHRHGAQHIKGEIMLPISKECASPHSHREQHDSMTHEFYLSRAKASSPSLVKLHLGI
jgi:hypothetical protein